MFAGADFKRGASKWRCVSSTNYSSRAIGDKWHDTCHATLQGKQDACSGAIPYSRLSVHRTTDVFQPENSATSGNFTRISTRPTGQCGKANNLRPPPQEVRTGTYADLLTFGKTRSGGLSANCTENFPCRCWRGTGSPSAQIAEAPDSPLTARGASARIVTAFRQTLLGRGGFDPGQVRPPDLGDLGRRQADEEHRCRRTRRRPQRHARLLQ
jgi:hypothetical protein